MIAPTDVAFCRGKFLQQLRCLNEGKSFSARLDAILNRAFLTNITMDKQELSAIKRTINEAKKDRVIANRAGQLRKERGVNISRAGITQFLRIADARSEFEAGIIETYIQAINERLEGQIKTKEQVSVLLDKLRQVQ